MADVSGMLPKISIVIPVLDEANGINDLISHLHALPGAESCEIIVVDGDPQGGTILALEDLSVLSLTAPVGRARQMNAGAARARGDILLFLHADTFLPQNALTSIHSVREDEAIIGGAFELGFSSQRLIFRMMGPLASLRSRATRVPYGDQAIFMRRSTFEQLGAYPDIPIMEDLQLMRNVKKRGHRIRILPHRVRTSPRRWKTEGMLYCTFRNITLVVLYYLGVPAERLARFYRNER
jgi:rSAM/selenodomain-associated transferase 2